VAHPRLHKLLVGAVDAFNRNPWSTGRLAIVDGSEQPFYARDGLWTHHAHEFLEDPAFQRAYRRGLEAGGWDYGWHWRVHVGLWAAGVGAALPGAFVECGTGRGFMASAICEYLGWSDRDFVLFDTFSPHKPDESGRQTEAGPRVAVYADGPEGVAANFTEWRGVRLVVGEVPGTLDAAGVEEVAFLHVDMNHPLPEAAAIEHFWPRLVSGGVMLLDDYGTFAQSRASADGLARKLGFSILSVPTGQGLAIKAPG
jgi:hypothetical protein